MWDEMFPDFLHSLSAGQEIARLRVTETFSALFTAEYRAAHEPSL